MKRLLLTAQSITNESIANALRQLVGKPTGKARLVYIPTSHNDAVGDKTWLLENMNNAHRLGWKTFEIIDVAAMQGLPLEQWWPSIEAADVLFVGGGANYYLGYWLEQCGLAAALPDLLENKVYVGSSAGSMFLTQSLRFSSQALKQLSNGEKVDLEQLGPPGQRSARSLQLVNFELRPHYKSAAYPYITDELLMGAVKAADTPLYAIDDNSAVKVSGNTIEIVSEGEWKIFKPGRQETV